MTGPIHFFNSTIGRLLRVVLGLAPSFTTARIRGSDAAVVSASSPPIDRPSAAILLGSTSACSLRYAIPASTCC
jgi:hypothetical protein